MNIQDIILKTDMSTLYWYNDCIMYKIVVVETVKTKPIINQ